MQIHLWDKTKFKTAEEAEKGKGLEKVYLVDLNIDDRLFYKTLNLIYRTAKALDKKGDINFIALGPDPRDPKCLRSYSKSDLAELSDCY